MTSAEAEKRYNAWLECQDALQFAESYSVEGHTVTRADGAFINSMITHWGERYDVLKAAEDAEQGNGDKRLTEPGVCIMRFDHGID